MKLAILNGSVLVMYHYKAGGELSTSCWEEVPSAFTLSEVVHRITTYQVWCPFAFKEGSYEEPLEKDMPPFQLKSRHLIQGMQRGVHNSTQLKDGRRGDGVNAT